MNQDPNYQLELQKYSHPIPSREFILNLLKKHKSLSRIEIFKLCSLNKDEQFSMLKRLRAMEKDSQIIFTRYKKYKVLDTKNNTIEGEIIATRSKFGFLKTESKDFFIPAYQMSKVINGDKVLASYSGSLESKKPNLTIIKVTEPILELMGKIELFEDKYYFFPNDNKIEKSFNVKENDDFSFKSMKKLKGKIVKVHLYRRIPFNNSYIEILSVLGKEESVNVQIDILLNKYKIPHTWDKDILKQAKAFGTKVDSKEIKNRIDLRKVPFVTIDGKDSKDFDDAVYAYKKTTGWILFVAIADVSHYVIKDTKIDIEARLRGNSVYFPNKVIPMLPSELSDELCSLNPKVNRLSLVCEMHLNFQGDLESYRFYEATIKSHKRLTYDKATKFLDKNKTEKLNPIELNLTNLFDIYKALNLQREQRGSIQFETIEHKFDIKKDKITLSSSDRTIAHKIIEECMCLANNTAGFYINQNKYIGLYRSHPKPTDEKLEFLKQILSNIKIDIKDVTTVDNKINYNLIIKLISKHEESSLIQMMLLRTLSQASYQTKNIGHFGLGLKYYTHFTSPIRRYPDLITHRTIKEIIAKETQVYSKSELDLIGKSSSNTEKKADDATYDLSNWLMCKHLQKYINIPMKGMISTISKFGVFITLKQFYIDGSLDYDNLNLIPNIENATLNSGEEVLYNLCDIVDIKIISIDPENLSIKLTLI
ncbi:MAG: ribonuclease R [Psittacicella sp.]